MTALFYIFVVKMTAVSLQLICVNWSWATCCDSAYSDVFKQIGKRFGPIDLSAIPIGAYNPRATMKYSHVNPEEAIKIHRDLQSHLSFGIHWATFKLTNEHYLEPKEKILQLMEEQPELKPFLVPNIGETIEGSSDENILPE